MRTELVTTEVLAREAGLHPELVRRLVRLGFTATPASLARATRLRHDLGIGWSGALLVGELLDRIDELRSRPLPAPRSDFSERA